VGPQTIEKEYGGKMTQNARLKSFDRKEEIINLKNEIRGLQGKLSDMIEGCQDHDFVIVGESVSCSICKKNFGWSCPKSPDKVCHYACEIEDGELALIDGTFTPPPTGVDADEFSEYCIYCGQPDERK